MLNTINCELKIDNHMAKQDGDIKLRGTIQNITFYAVDDQYLARKKSSLDGKRFFKDEAFEGSRRSCKRLGLGSTLASTVYQSLPKAKKKYPVFCELRSVAVMLLKVGKSEQEVLHALDGVLRRKRKVKRERSKRVRRSFTPRVFMVFPVEMGGRRRMQRRTIEKLLRGGKWVKGNPLTG